MPITTITVDSDYGYVILAAASTFVLNTVHGFTTGKFRKAAGVAYPAPYASDALAEKDVKAYQFNCAQRSHVTFIENQPTLLASLLISGLQYPRASAVMGLGWTAGRLAYMLGYVKPDIKSKGKGRYAGIIFNLFQLGLLGLTVSTGITLVKSGL